MKLADALIIAERVKSVLAPHCDRIEIAGGCRRLKPEPHDIEIVAIPKSIGSQDLFGHSSVARDRDFIRAALALGHISKGDIFTGKFIQIDLPGGENNYGITLDLFCVVPENWGFQFAIRTGSADYSHNVLGAAWVKVGFHGVDGFLCRGNDRVPVREEKDLFSLIGVPWVMPEARI